MVSCNVPKRGWINGVGGCPNAGGICIGCTMPGFPDKFMPFMDEPPGAKMLTAAVLMYGRTVRSLRNFTRSALDQEPDWRRPTARRSASRKGRGRERVSDNHELEHPLARIGELIEGLEHLPDADARERARALVQAVLDIHRVGLSRVLEVAAARDGGDAVVDELAADQAVALLLSLHGLHPRGVETRVREAVEELRPQLLDVGVAVELARVTDDSAHVRVKAAGSVRTGGAAIRSLVEGAIGRAAPEIAEVEIDGLDPSPLVSISRLPQR